MPLAVVKGETSGMSSSNRDNQDNEDIRPSTPASGSPYECSPEYFFPEFPGEDFSISTAISWQNFPRSTSLRSECDLTSEEIHKSITSTPVSVAKETEEILSKQSSTIYPITKSLSQLKAQHYLNVRHIFDLFNFLIGHLVCNEPEDPVQFLIDLLTKCAKYRDSYGEPPLLFTHAHVKSLYKAFDAFERGAISIEQYHEAMKSLGLINGITPYNKEPPVNHDGDVEEDNFMFEAERCLLENMKKMFRIPEIKEESSVRRKKKILKRSIKESIQASELDTSSKRLETDEEIEGNTCECLEETEEKACLCPPEIQLKCEPEQLFMDMYNTKKL